MADGYTIKRIDEFEEMEGSGGATWRLARKTLGAEAFGFNVVDIAAGGQTACATTKTTPTAA